MLLCSLTNECCCACLQQEAVKGSQGQGRVDESLDASKRAAPEAGAAQQAPSGKAATKSVGGGRRKGRR